MDRATPVRVLVVDDHPVAREGLVSMLEASGEIEVVAEAADAACALDAAQQLKPQVVLLDFRLPTGYSLDACRSLHAGVPEARVIVLTSYQEEDYLFEALRAGAWGYLSKTAPLEEIVAAVRAAVDGRRLLSPALVDKLLARYEDLAGEVERDAGAGAEAPPAATEIAALKLRKEEYDADRP